MLFNSISFGVFFATVFVLLRAIGDWQARKIILVLASYVFYASWHPAYCLLLLFITLLDFALSQALEAVRPAAARKLIVAASVSANLAVLGFFKYGGFLIENVNTGLNAIGAPLLPPLQYSLVIPVGLSFYTFQSMAYIVDVYRREMAAAKSLLDYLTFVSFFPTLLAGPIVRAREFLPQLKSPRALVDLPTAGSALWLVIVGLFQKVVMADNIAPLVNVVFKTPSAFSTLDLWTAVYAFAFQIYFDFAGYSSIAIGLAMLLGFELPQNFNHPYLARGFSDFWRRWHITLSRWLRDYLYISLGGNRHGRVKTARNLMLTMLLGGLWHGPSWTFVVWGALHGTYLGIERFMIGRRAATGTLSQPSPIRRALGDLGAMLLTFHLVLLAWVLFRAEGLGQALTILTSMMWPSNQEISPLLEPYTPFVLLPVAFLVVQQVCTAFRIEILFRLHHKAMLAGLMLAAVVLIPGERNAFIYFQF